jgi:apolipoprotein N-acyltransferase
MTATATPRSARSARPAPAPVDRTVSDIIDGVRKAPAPRAGALLVTAVTAVLMWGAFYPLDWGPLAWIAPVPFLLLARITHPTRWMYRCVYAGGLLFWVPALQWMRLGDPAMIPAWLALAFYLALYFPVALAIIRLAVHRLRAPLVVAAPIVWIGLEYLRTHLMTGFGWYLVGHSQHDFTSLIQISDLCGAYGVSFVVMVAAAALAECLPSTWFYRFKLVPPVCDLTTAVVTATNRRRAISVLASILIVASAVLYGVYRRDHAEFPNGPRVALVQGDFRSEVKHDPGSAREIYLKHVQLTGLAVDYRPDVVIWPETMCPYPLMKADPKLTPEQLREQFPHVDAATWSDPRADIGNALRDKAEQAGTRMIIGVGSMLATQSGPERYNSAVFVEPQVGVTGRYDKLHRVPFGEYIPLRDWLPFLAGASSFAAEMGIDAGREVHVFTLGNWRLLPLICFEDTVPHLVRNMTNAADAPTESNPSPRPVDLLVNLTNDGWFRDSSEQEQHLITATFRCIETRTPMVRAVNTGVSAVIDGDGLIREPLAFVDYDRHPAVERDPNLRPRESLRDPKTGRFHKSLNATLVADVPLDPRGSLYLRWGDWFAGACLVLTLASLGWSALVRPQQKIAA